MTCPFLKEAQVKYCRTSTVRKLIPLAQTGCTEEKCSSDAHRTCSVFQMQPEEGASGPCPYLRESLMQYCGAAPVARFIPYSESILSRCGNDSFRYCELYSSMAHPEPQVPEVEGIAMPERLRYTANHMWIDVGEDGTCHAGVDAFLSRTLGEVDSLTYVWQEGRRRPTAVFSAGGMDLEIVFPNPFLLTGCNLYLRAKPSRIATEPYSGGWLFEGRPLSDTFKDVKEGAEARAWMEREQHRMSEFLQTEANAAGACLADGGLFAPGVARQLGRDRRLTLFHEFFSPYASGKREP